MKFNCSTLVIDTAGRSPHGERGLKSKFYDFQGSQPESLSSRRAWIEIVHIKAEKLCELSRSPHGERGLK